ncbi:MAG: hypothetical protein ABIA76_06090 [Candidatus Diapherotrites archaeon]
MKNKEIKKGYKLTKKCWQQITEYFNKHWKTPDKFPDKAILLCDQEEEKLRVNTINTIKK